MTQADPIRRHPDGSIDFDFYRADAKALHRRAWRDALARRGGTAGVLVAMAFAIGFVVLAGSAARNDVNVAAGAAAERVR